MKKIVFVLTGGIAEYKVIELIRNEMKLGNDVRVAMTEMATKFVTPLTFSTLTNHDVLTDFENHTNKPVAHVELADWADLIVIAPATANFMSKMAMGLADDFASTMVLASHASKLVIPAMNVNMWNNPATQRNVNILVQDGIKVMEPDDGLLAEGYRGKGRFPKNESIIRKINKQLESGSKLSGKHILVTAGGTREPIDSVRFIGNRSSGKMGFAIAKAAYNQGAHVTLISGPTKLPAIPGVKTIFIQTVDDLQNAINEYIKQADALVMAAAVSDYRVATVADHKLKKSEFYGTMQLQLVENPDVLANLEHPDNLKFVVGFAAESENLLANGQTKLKKKHVDMIVANDISKSDTGFDSDDNAVTLIRPELKPEVIKKQSKKLIAQRIIDIISDQL